MNFQKGDRIKLTAELKCEKFSWSPNVIVSIQAVDEKRERYQIEQFWFDAAYIELIGKAL